MSRIVSSDKVSIYMIKIIIEFIENKVGSLIDFFVQDKREDRSHLKRQILVAVEETRKGLAELQVNQFKVMHGNRWLTRMKALVEKLSLADPELGTMVWNLFNTPTRIESMERMEQYNPRGQSSESIVEISKIKEKYFVEIKQAMERLNEIEKNPLSRKRKK